MCLAVPMKLLKIDGVKGTVEMGNVNYEVNLELIDKPEIGGYLIIHAGFAINKIDKEEAIITLDLFKQINGKKDA